MRSDMRGPIVRIVGTGVLVVVWLAAMTTLIWALDRWVETGSAPKIALASAAAIAAVITVTLAEDFADWFPRKSAPRAPGPREGGQPPRASAPDRALPPPSRKLPQP